MNERIEQQSKRTGDKYRGVKGNFEEVVRHGELLNPRHRGIVEGVTRRRT